MSTDTNQASELYELCKEVYEATEWYIPNTEGFMNKHGLMGQPWVAPLYNTDYLLEKLPKRINVSMDLLESETNLDVYYGQEAPLVIYADTPLKALLKLTIALSEAGELK